MEKKLSTQFQPNDTLKLYNPTSELKSNKTRPPETK